MLAGRMMSAVKQGPSLIKAAYWRILVHASGGSTTPYYVQTEKLDFRPIAGVNYQPVSGTASASSNNGTGAFPQYAFDGNTSDRWQTIVSPAMPQWLTYKYTNAISPVQLYIYDDVSSRRPTSFDAQYSHDGSTWTTIKSFSNVAYSYSVFTGTIQ